MGTGELPPVHSRLKPLRSSRGPIGNLIRWLVVQKPSQAGAVLTIRPVLSVDPLPQYRPTAKMQGGRLIG
jgi:hypothetical protein